MDLRAPRRRTSACATTLRPSCARTPPPGHTAYVCELPRGASTEPHTSQRRVGRRARGRRQCRGALLVVLPCHGVLGGSGRHGRRLKRRCSLRSNCPGGAAEGGRSRRGRASGADDAHAGVSSAISNPPPKLGAGAAASVAGGGTRRPPRPPSGGTTLTAEPLLLYSHQGRVCGGMRPSRQPAHSGGGGGPGRAPPERPPAVSARSRARLRLRGIE
jgi:hypothetical protein